jgi:hypothetical protein
VHPLDERYQRTIDEELGKPGTRAPLYQPSLPEPLKETLLEYGQPEHAVQFYCERMPRMLVEQTLRGDDPARALLHRPIDLYKTPRLREALAKFPEAPPVTTIAKMAGQTLLGRGLPMVGAYPPELALINEELNVQNADEVLDLRLSGALVHELCHRETGLPWMALEAKAAWLGLQVFPRHIFPEQPGEAVPAVSLFAMLGQVLERCGERRDILYKLAREDWARNPEVPFARNALDVMSWIEAVQGDWAEQDPQALDYEIARTAVRSLFQVNLFAPTFQTHPLAEIRGLTLEKNRVRCDPHPRGVFGEPPFWVWPPPLRRNARTFVIDRVRREEIPEVTERLIEWTSSKS